MGKIIDIEIDSIQQELTVEEDPNGCIKMRFTVLEAVREMAKKVIDYNTLHKKEKR